ncbi:unnamed protein product [Gongylonema pulchrum]|uniref:LysM domain-containing protein n=1 Tax=Gongylonema pulchrum TaxID=637853 RepID=A0A183E8K3_9BILA|nr:unnamed protein product [Gongylonema pulchrum]
MEYTVTESDSIEGIAAVHDCTVGELMKMNRLAARMVFPGQKLVVPCPVSEDDAFQITEDRVTNQPDSGSAPGSGLISSQCTILAREYSDLRDGTMDHKFYLIMWQEASAVWASLCGQAQHELYRRR